MQRGFYINLLDFLSSWYSAQIQVNSISKNRRNVALQYTAFKHLFYKAEVLSSSPRYSVVLFCTYGSVIFLVAKYLVKSNSSVSFSQRCSTAVIYTGVDLEKLRWLVGTLKNYTLQLSLESYCANQLQCSCVLHVQNYMKHTITSRSETFARNILSGALLCITGWVWVH